MSIHIFSLIFMLFVSLFFRSPRTSFRKLFCSASKAESAWWSSSIFKCTPWGVSWIELVRNKRLYKTFFKPTPGFHQPQTELSCVSPLLLYRSVRRFGLSSHDEAGRGARPQSHEMDCNPASVFAHIRGSFIFAASRVRRIEAGGVWLPRALLE